MNTCKCKIVTLLMLICIVIAFFTGCGKHDPYTTVSIERNQHANIIQKILYNTETNTTHIFDYFYTDDGRNLVDVQETIRHDLIAESDDCKKSKPQPILQDSEFSIYFLSVERDATWDGNNYLFYIENRSNSDILVYGTDYTADGKNIVESFGLVATQKKNSSSMYSCLLLDKEVRDSGLCDTDIHQLEFTLVIVDNETREVILTKHIDLRIYS